MIVLCYKCKHFIGQEIYGEVHCKILGRIPSPMSRCIYFEPKEGTNENDRNKNVMYGRPVTTDGEVVE